MLCDYTLGASHLLSTFTAPNDYREANFGETFQNVAGQNDAARIQNLEVPQEYRLLNFGERVRAVSHGVGQGRNYKYFEIARDGLKLLVMGLTIARKQIMFPVRAGKIWCVRIRTLLDSQRSNRAFNARYFYAWTLSELLWGGHLGRVSGLASVAVRHMRVVLTCLSTPPYPRLEPCLLAITHRGAL